MKRSQTVGHNLSHSTQWVDFNPVQHEKRKTNTVSLCHLCGVKKICLIDCLETGLVFYLWNAGLVTGFSLRSPHP